MKIQLRMAGPCRAVLLDYYRNFPQNEVRVQTLQLITGLIAELPS